MKGAGTDLSDQEEKTRGRLSGEEIFPNTPKPGPKLPPCGESCGRATPVRDPKSFGRLGARIPKGVLLIGHQEGREALCRILGYRQ
jgi:hypothetical protein